MEKLKNLSSYVNDTIRDQDELIAPFYDSLHGGENI